MITKPSVSASEIILTLESYRNEEQRAILSRFFKTAPGQYGHGDMFLGLKVPVTRAVVKEARLRVPLSEIEMLLKSEWHEARLCGLLLLVEEMKAALPSRRKKSDTGADRRRELTGFYLRHAGSANNWDLVDLSAPYILGTFLLHPLPDGSMPDTGILDRLAASGTLWEQRIAIVATLSLIRSGRFDDTLRIAHRLLTHPHDLIHKATGWMLREVGKRDADVLRRFLESHSGMMPRTALRYAIERFSDSERNYWLTLKSTNII